MHEPGPWRPQRLLVMNAIFAFAMLLWFIPPIRELISVVETQIFYTLNGTLFDSPRAQAFWGTVNHRYEGKVMPWFVASLQLTAVLFAPRQQRRKLFAQLLFFWAAMQLLIPAGNLFFQKFLAIRRVSPSLVLEPSMRLAPFFHNHLIRDQSALSFYSGHSFVFAFYAYVAVFCLPRFYKVFFVGLAIAMNFPRLVSGGHWITDCIFATLLACFWMTWITATPLHVWGTAKARRLLDFIKSPRPLAQTAAVTQAAA